MPRPAPRSVGTITVKAISQDILNASLTMVLSYRCKWRIGEDEVKSAVIAGMKHFAKVAKERGLGELPLPDQPGFIPHRDEMGFDMVLEAARQKKAVDLFGTAAKLKLPGGTLQ